MNLFSYLKYQALYVVSTQIQFEPSNIRHNHEKNAFREKLNMNEIELMNKTNLVDRVRV